MRSIWVQNNEIKVIQNLLVKQNKYELSIKLDGAYYRTEFIQEWNGVSSVTLEIYVHPNYYLDLLHIAEDEKEIIKLVFKGLIDSSTFIQDVEFKIDKDVKVQSISDTIYIFVDEAGDMDFSLKGSKHYMFNFLIKNRPFNLHEYISNYRYSLLERNLDPLNNTRIDIEYFHACNDNKHIKNELFNIISTFDKEKVKVYSYILEKSKVHPEKRQERDSFYIDNLTYSIGKLLD